MLSLSQKLKKIKYIFQIKLFMDTSALLPENENDFFLLKQYRKMFLDDSNIKSIVEFLFIRQQT